MCEEALRNPADTSLPRTEEDVTAALRKWLDDQPGDHYHPLLDWSGESKRICCFACIVIDA